jgi:hypothetical protein
MNTTNVVWTYEQAEAYVNGIKDMVKSFGFDIAIVGGVRERGYSDHDLDLVFAPIDNKAMNNVDWVYSLGKSEVSSGLGAHGQQKTIELHDGRHVDIFFNKHVYDYSPKLDPETNELLNV